MTSLLRTKSKELILTEELPQIRKGASDWRKYRQFSLPNGITCVLVNDEESKTTSCAVAIGVGASADPRELSGLAHFTEHMSFLGSEAYPKENEFKKYLSAHGGRSNASTSMMQTLYCFDIAADRAEKAIDIFSNFFYCPLFTQSGTNREVNAVDSENSKNESNDGRRRLQILKALADPHHHYSKFSTGNIKTLPAVDGEKGKFVREALLAFHKKHYVPENMTVVAVGPQHLDLLEEWLVPRFSKIFKKEWSNKTNAEALVDASANDFPADSFGSPSVPFNPAFRSEVQGGEWPVLLTTRPLHSMRKLCLYFPLPSTVDKAPSYALLCSLLGHEGPGSCFAALQDANLADALSVGPRLSEADQSLLQISISLTKEGENSWGEVVNILFKYCQLLHALSKRAKAGDASSLESFERIWDEICTLRTLKFNQTSPNQAYPFARFLASRVRRWGTTKCLSKDSLLEESKESLPLDNFLEYIERIIPENCILERCSKAGWDELEEDDNREVGSIFGFQEEKWYGVKYHLTPINRRLSNLWKSEIAAKAGSIIIGDLKLHLPNANHYITRDLSLCSDLPEGAKEQARIAKVMKPPKLLIQNAFGRLWHKLDDRYCLPKSIISILIRNPEVENVPSKPYKEWVYDINGALHSTILINIFKDALAQQMYDAKLAGFTWHLSKSSSGLTLKFSGYTGTNSKHLINFALQIINRFFAKQEAEKHSFIKEIQLKAHKDKYLRNLKSFMESKRADAYAMYYTDLLLSSQGKDTAHAITITESITAESLKEHHRRIISADVHVECLFAGNVSDRDARYFFSETQLSMSQGRVVPIRSTPTSALGPLGRKLEAGEEIQLHFQSKNKEEQNGSVLMTYQSAIPSYMGWKDCEPEILTQTAAVRTICHILREPLFNQLRTKEQLGYIVSSNYSQALSSICATVDRSTSSVEDMVEVGTSGIDSIVIRIVSKKLPPPIITQRIDHFLCTFQQKLSILSEEDLKSHTGALSMKLRNPKQNLGDEVGMYMRKITNHAPNFFNKGMSLSDFPWDMNTALAKSVQSLQARDLLEAWERIIAGRKRTRIVSHVYGSTFPLMKLGNFQQSSSNKAVVLQSLNDIYKKRKSLVQFSETVPGRQIMVNPITRTILKKKRGIALGIIVASCFICAIHVLGPEKGSEEKTKEK